MSFKTDTHGLAFSCLDIKLQANGSTWGMRLSQLARQSGCIRILTYSLPDVDYVAKQLGRRPHNICLLAHAKFREKALAIAQAFPQIAIALHPRIHSKVLLCEPGTVVVSSANFGSSTWEETSISLHDRTVHDWYLGHVYQRLWVSAQEVKP